MAGGYVPYGKETGSKVGDADIVRLEHEIKERFLKEAGIKQCLFQYINCRMKVILSGSFIIEYIILYQSVICL